MAPTWGREVLGPAGRHRAEAAVHVRAAAQCPPRVGRVESCVCTPPTCASETWAPLSLSLHLGGFSHQLTVRTWAQLPERSETAGAGEDLAIGSFIPAERITRQRRPAQDPTGPGWLGVLTEGSELFPLRPSRGLHLSRPHPDPFCPNTHQRHRRWPGHWRPFRRGLAAALGTS